LEAGHTALLVARAETATEVSVRGHVANFRFGDWRNGWGGWRSDGGGWRNCGGRRNGCRLLSSWFFIGFLGVGFCGFLGEGVRRQEARHYQSR
jgi:hypothetical protein